MIVLLSLKLSPPLPRNIYVVTCLTASRKSERNRREVAIILVFSGGWQFEDGTMKTKEHGLFYNSCSMFSRCHQCCKPHPLANVGRAFQVRALLKVPKREIIVTELFILSDPIWVDDLRNEPKKPLL
jgi:hypothetical protein